MKNSIGQVILELISNIKNGLTFQGRYTWYTLKKWPFVVVLYMIFIGVLGMLEPIEVFAQREVINRILLQDISTLVSAFVFWLIVSVLFVFQNYASPLVQRIVGLKVASWIQGKIYQNLHKMPLVFFDDADNNIKIDRAKETVYHISNGPVVLMYNLAYFLSLGIAVVHLSNYFIILLLYLASGFLGAIVNIVQKQYRENINKLREIDQRKLVYLRELQQSKEPAIENRINGYNIRFNKEWNKMKDILFTEEIKIKKRQMVQQIITNTIQQGLSIGVFVFVLTLVIGNQIDLGGFAAITGMGAVVSSRIGYIFGAFEKSIESGVYIDDIEEVLDMKTPDKKHMLQASNDKYILKFNNVSFGYNPKHLVLKNISFSLGYGEIIALVGANGSGKTTLSKLALGLYEPLQGEVLGINDSSVVFQDFMKYEFSIRENIGFGCLDILNNDDKIFLAANKGGFKQIIDERKFELHTILGRRFDETGQELSGGEWQRLALSRGFASDAKLLIFDEPTASIDPINEVKLFKYVREYVKGKSAVIVSHRVGICTLADRIIFLQDGRIEEIGTHNELYMNKGKYYEFFNEQTQWYDFGA